MKIGEFLKECETTKDTVRHYEELGLLTPSKKGNLKDYSEKEALTYHVIQEMKQLGLSLKEISAIVELKSRDGCASPALIKGAQNQLMVQLEKVKEEETRLAERRMQLNSLIQELSNQMRETQ